MKKIYIMPDVLVTKIQLQKMIASSDPKSTLLQQEAVADGEVLSRESGRNSLWDDDED